MEIVAVETVNLMGTMISESLKIMGTMVFNKSHGDSGV
jgi:hypothetical protein